MYKTIPHRRYSFTLDFLKKHVPKHESILDLGVSNPFSDIMKSEGYTVENTKGEDLDEDTSTIENSNATCVTAFEIFEHLLSPYTVLKAIKTDKLIISVPLKLWFAPAYRSKTDMRDRHYHEFEDWQLDWLLEKTGWIIQDRIKWTNPTSKIGLRPLLRRFIPRYYMVYAIKANYNNPS